MIEKLLQRGVQNRRGVSYRGPISHVELLLRQGAQIDAMDINGKTLLHIACESGNLPMIGALIESGANVHLADRNGMTPSMIRPDEVSAAVASKIAKESRSHSEAATTERPSLGPHTARIIAEDNANKGRSLLAL